MSRKYEILVNSDRGCSIIERAESTPGKEYWNIFVPDAGSRNVASRVARLLNEEYDKTQEIERLRKEKSDE